MRYFVIGDDGQKYGPADVATLQTWIGEGRLLPTQQLEEETSGMRQAAAAVSGLRFPTSAPQGAPGAAPGGAVPSGSPYAGTQPASPYMRPAMQSSGDNGQSDVTTAWVCFAIGFLTCLGLILYPVAIVFANRALSKGNDGGKLPKILSWIFLSLAIIGIVLYIILLIVAVNSGAMQRQPGMMPTR